MTSSGTPNSPTSTLRHNERTKWGTSAIACSAASANSLHSDWHIDATDHVGADLVTLASQRGVLRASGCRAADAALTARCASTHKGFVTRVTLIAETTKRHTAIDCVADRRCVTARFSHQPRAFVDQLARDERAVLRLAQVGGLSGKAFRFADDGLTTEAVFASPGWATRRHEPRTV